MPAVGKKAFVVIALFLMCIAGCASHSTGPVAATEASGPDIVPEPGGGPVQTRATTTTENEGAESPARSAPQGLVKIKKKKTIEELERQVDLLPSHAPAYNELGFAYAKKGDYERAIANYNKALELDRCYDWAFYNRGCAWYDQRKYDAAIDDYSKALKCNPQYADAYNNRGNARFQKQQYDEAFQDYAKSVELRPRYAAAHYNLGNAWCKKGRYREAIAEFTKAVQLKPRYSAGFNNRGVAFLLLEQYDNAEKDLMTALELSPGNNSTMVRLAELYSMKKDIMEACRWLERGVDNGYRDFKYIKSTVTLDNIRKWPCYESALSTR